ncbi:MAG: hypothetical protein EBR82_09590 [Caulobacteraceae bacterium]|nr:hypothetical protein [Caulobacteraceae bacterium]
MSSTATVLLQSTFVATGAAALLYTSPAAGKGTWVDNATALNDNAGPQTLTLHHVPAAGAAAAVNQLTKAKSIATGATDLLPELRGKFLKPGDAIWGVASAATAISLNLSGRELT